jgi:hypothetical protein
MERAERIVQMLGALILYAIAIAFVSASIYISVKNADKPAFVDPPCSAQSSPAHK